MALRHLHPLEEALTEYAVVDERVGIRLALQVKVDLLQDWHIFRLDRMLYLLDLFFFDTKTSKVDKLQVGHGRGHIDRLVLPMEVLEHVLALVLFELTLANVTGVVV